MIERSVKLEEEDMKHAVPILRPYWIFNREWVDDLPETENIERPNLVDTIQTEGILRPSLLEQCT